MAQTFEFYDARAKEAAAEAKTATLVMVRERALRSEKAWRGMAEQARKIETEREKAERARAQRRTREEAEAAEAAQQAEPPARVNCST